VCTILRKAVLLMSTLASLQLGETDEPDESSGEETDGKDEIDSLQAKTPKPKNKRKKKKKKPQRESAAEEEGKRAAEDGTNGPGKTAPRKSKGNDGKATSKDVSDMSMDEFSALLASQALLDQKSAAFGADSAGTSALLNSTGPLPSLRAHLSLSAPYLDPAIELKRQFGAAAIKAYETEASSNSGRGASSTSSARARSLAWNTNFKTRSILVQPQDTWPPIAKTFTGMTMETIDDEERGKTGGWVHSRYVVCLFLCLVTSASLLTSPVSLRRSAEHTERRNCNSYKRFSRMNRTVSSLC
jgi:hypothetical protein